MPIWTQTPPADDEGFPYRIVRTPADKPLTALITSPDMVGTVTHFVKNRTVPCEGVDSCPWCAEGHSWRWHGYVACLLTPTLQHVLFELTATAVDPLRTYADVYGDLRGCMIKAYRPSKRHNGRVLIECRRTDPMKTPLPEPPDIKRVLCHIWNIQYNPSQAGPMLRPPARELRITAGNGDGRYQPEPPDDAA